MPSPIESQTEAELIAQRIVNSLPDLSYMLK
jgi:hypothetical protein